MNRRGLLRAGAGAAIIGVSGCLGAVADVAARTASGPAVAYVPSDGAAGISGITGDSKPIVGGFKTQSVTNTPVTVSGTFAGLSGELDIDGWFASGAFRSKNFNSTRSNRRDLAGSASGDGDTDGDGWDQDAATAYLDGDAVVGEQFLLSLPNTSLPTGDQPMEAFSPHHLLDAVTAGFDTVSGMDSETEVVEFRRADERVAGVVLQGVRSEVRNVAVHTGVDKTSPKLYTALDDDSDGDGLPGEWPAERSVGGGGVTGTILGSAVVSVATGDGEVALPALLHMKRVRHGGDYLFAGGWVLDAGHLYTDSATLLVEDGPNEVVGLSAADLADGDDALVRSRLARERSLTGSLVYDGPATRDALPFLPAGFREGDGLDRFASISKRSARKGRNPQTGKEIKIPAKRVARLGNTVETVLARTGGCNLDVCGELREHAEGRIALVESAEGSLEQGDTAAARDSLMKVLTIVEDDIERLAGVDDRQAVGDLLNLEHAARREVTLALDPVDADADGDGLDEETVELAIERVERAEGVTDEDGDGAWDAIDLSAVDGGVSVERLRLEGETLGYSHTATLKEGRKGMNAVNVQRTVSSGGGDGDFDGDDDLDIAVANLGVAETSGGDHRVTLTVVSDPAGLAMTKSELVEAIATGADVSRAHAERTGAVVVDTASRLHAGIEKHQIKRGMVVARPGLSGDDEPDPGGGKEIKIPLLDGDDGGDGDGTVLKTTLVPLDGPLVHLAAGTRSLKKGDRVALVGFGSFEVSSGG